MMNHIVASVKDNWILRICVLLDLLISLRILQWRTILRLRVILRFLVSTKKYFKL